MQGLNESEDDNINKLLCEAASSKGFLCFSHSQGPCLVCLYIILTNCQTFEDYRRQITHDGDRDS